VTGATLRLTEADRRHLATGAACLGIELTEPMLTTLSGFADVLDVWSRKTNLLSCGSARELVERHLLDSLAISPLLPSQGLLVDLGSGAGFPGLPLAIQRPDQTFLLVEARRKRASFLREVRRTLQLTNVQIHEGRAECPPSEHASAAAGVMTRAVWSGGELTAIAPTWLAPKGRVYWMRTDPLSNADDPAPLRKVQTVQYRIAADRRKTVEVLGID
jgi:16S rRNA (guanine527-N7)-methyltransferase